MYQYFVSAIGTDGWPIALEMGFGSPFFIQFPVQLKHQSAFFIHVRAVNFAGLQTEATSELVMVDVTPPVISHVSDFGVGDAELDLVRVVWSKCLDRNHGFNTHLDICSCAQVRGPSLDWVVTWEVYDDESGVEQCEICLGGMPGMCDVFTPTTVDCSLTALARGASLSCR